MLDLNKTDEYENYVIPDKDIEITLKVLRTLRGVYLGGPGGFDAGFTVLLSHAHAAIYEKVKDTIDNYPESVVPDEWETLVDALKAYKTKWEGLREEHISSNEALVEDIKRFNEFADINKVQNYYSLLSKYTSQIFMAQWLLNSIRGGIGHKHSTNICNILWED